MSVVLNIISSIPDVFWSGLLASAATLSGVFLSNTSNNKRMKIQLQHDSEQKNKERQLTLRRPVYLEFIGELTKLIQKISPLTSVDGSNLSDYINDTMYNFFASAARAQLIAEPRSAQLIDELRFLLIVAMLTIMRQWFPAAFAKIDIDVAESCYNRYSAEIDRILDEQIKLEEAGHSNEYKYEVLSQRLSIYLKNWEEYAATRNSAYERFNKFNVEFQKAIILECIKLQPYLLDLMIELRRDLGLTVELGELAEQMRRRTLEMQEKLREYLDFINNDLVSAEGIKQTQQ